MNTNYLENLFGAVDVKQIQIMQQDIKNINKTIETYKTSNDQMQSIIKDKLDIVNF